MESRVRIVRLGAIGAFVFGLSLFAQPTPSEPTQGTPKPETSSTPGADATETPSASQTPRMRRTPMPVRTSSYDMPGTTRTPGTGESVSGSSGGSGSSDGSSPPAPTIPSTPGGGGETPRGGRMRTPSPGSASGTTSPGAVGTETPTASHPTSAADCGNEGWRSYTKPKFRSQKGCENYVRHHARKTHTGATASGSSMPATPAASTTPRPRR
jgi:hypothetical protein